MSDRQVHFGYRDVSPEEKQALVGAAFDTVAATYDFANRLFSLAFDASWRRTGVRLLGLKPGDRVLDVCGGTGPLALGAARCTGPDGMAVVLDMNTAMLEAGRRRQSTRRDGSPLRWAGGNAESLPFPDASFDAVTIGFGLRNIVHLDLAFREAARVLKPGGGFMAVEFGLPRHRLLRRLYDFYAFCVMPLAARLLFGSGKPYRYLAESIRVFQAPGRTSEMLETAGLAGTRILRLTAGVAVVFLARKPNSEGV